MSFFDVLTAAASRPTVAGAVSQWASKRIGAPQQLWNTFGGRSAAGRSVTIDSALQLSTVWACVRLISETIATLPLVLYKRLPDGSREPAKDHPLYNILRQQPNYDMTAVQMVEAIAASMLLWGNAYSEKRKQGKEIVSINLLLPSKMKTTLNDDGSIKYTYTRKQGQEIINEKDILHIPAFSLDGRMGLSPIAYGANVMGSAMSADDAAGATFKNGLMRTVAFKIDRVLPKEQREEFRDLVEANLLGPLNVGRPAIMEGGIDAKELGINPNDAQMLETRGFSVEEICRFYRVPPWMVGHTQSSTSWGTGMEQQMLGFLTFTLRPWLARIEQAIRKSLLEPEERDTYYAEFGIEGLLRADSASRAAFYSTMTQNGIYTRDDCREKENLPRMGGNAAVLTVQTNLTPLDQLGQAKDTASAIKNLLGITDANENEAFNTYMGKAHE